MLIRLIPLASQPTVLFKLVFENLPDTIQTPSGWIHQLNSLDDELESPPLIHALDKAVGVQSILDQVSFDLVEEKIKCIFFDGELEEWDIASIYYGLMDEVARQRKLDLVRRLDSVIDDVNESAAEMDKERKREEELREQQQRLKEEEDRQVAAKQDNKEEPAVPSEPPVQATRKNRPGHKKQRSLLMNLVSALIPLSLNSPRTPRSPRSSLSSLAARPTSPVSSIRSYFSEKQTHPTSEPSTLSRSATLPNLRSMRRDSTSSSSSPGRTTIESPLSSPSEFPVVIVAPPKPPPLSPRALRRRARSTLVDAFRLYVLPELNRRIRCSHMTGSPGSITACLYVSEISSPYYAWVVGSTLKRVNSRLNEIGKELRDEMDAIGVEMSTLPLGALGGLGLGAVASQAERGGPVGHSPPSPSSDSSSNADGTHLEARTGNRDTDNMSDVTLIDTSISSISDSGDSSAAHHHQPKSSLPVTPVIGFASSKYLMSSSYSEIPTPAPIAHPEVPLPESLNELLLRHNELSSIHLRLAHLLLAAHTQAAAAAADIAQREAILEVRGRRRAWLNRTLNVCPRAEHTAGNAWSGAMSSPFRPSGLGKYSYSSEEWECDPYHHLDTSRSFSTLVTDIYPNPFDSPADASYAAYTYAHRRKRSVSETGISLFPVCEEEGYEDEDSNPRKTSPRGHLDVEIDEDDEDDDEDDGEDTDVDSLADIDLDGSDLLRKPSRQSLDILKDPFSAPEDDLRASSSLS